jgi:hypothetical protein
MDNMPYKIGIRKGDFQIIVQGDKEWVESKFKELLSEHEITRAAPEKITNETSNSGETLGEFLDLKGNPEKHTDTVAIFAYWLFKKEGLQCFNVKDIISCYDMTRKAKPVNPNMIINANISTHLFAPAADKKDGFKAWVITRTGEKYVEQIGTGV